MLTHIVRHIFPTAGPTNFNLGIWMEDDDHQPQVPLPPRSKVTVERSRDQLLAVLAQRCARVIRGRRGHTVSAEHGGHTSCSDQ